MQRQLRDELSKHDFDSAIETCEELKVVAETAYETPNPILAATWNNLGLAFKGKGDFDQAARNLAKATQEYEACGLANHPSTATALHNLGVCYKENAQQSKALSRDPLLESAASCLREALERRNALSGNFDVDLNERAIASTRVVLASVLRLQKRTEEATKEIDDALHILRTAFNRDPTNTHAATALATALNNLGLFQKQDSNYDDAKTLYDEALHLRSDFLGHDHPHTIATLYNIAELLQANGLPDKADDIRRDIIKRLDPDASFPPT